MAMENKRIIQLSTERTTLGDDDYTIVDSDTNGTAKYRLSRLKETDTTLSVSGMAADAAATGQAINAETQARTQAVAAETQARQQAISAESQARAAADTTLGNDVQDLKSAIKQNDDWFNRNVLLTGNLFPFYIEKKTGVYVNDQNGQLVYSSGSSYNSYIIPVKKNTTYSLTNGRFLALLDDDRKTLIGERQQNITSFNSGNAYYVAFSFAPGDYPESTFVFSEGTALSTIQGEIGFDRFALTLEQQKYLSNNLYQEGWELGDIGSSYGDNQPGLTTLRTKGYCPVFSGEAYIIRCYKSITSIGYVYQYGADKTYLGYAKIITVNNGIAFTTASSCRYIRMVLVSAYGTTFGNDIVFLQNGGIVRNVILQSERNINVIPTIIVDKNGNGDYTSLTAAVAASSNGDIIFVRKGIYENEIVEAWNKNITIIGESPYNTIIQNELDDYNTPPIEMSVGALYDIQFYSIGNETQRHAYALHIDNDNQLNGTFYAENCIFKTDYGSGAVGAGMRRNCVQCYRNCVFENGHGPAFFGNETTQQQAGGITNSQYYKFYNCTFKTDGNGSVVIMRGMKSNGSTVYCTYVGCVFMDDGSNAKPAFRMDYTSEEYMGTSTNEGDMGIINWNLDPISFGNSIPDLNGAKEGMMYIVTRS